MAGTIADSSNAPDDPAIQSAGEPINSGTETEKPKTADRPHGITIALGLLSPALALVSLGVSMWVFHDSQRSTRIAQRAYLGFRFEAAQLTAKKGVDNVLVKASVSIKDIGNTPAYIRSVQKELYLINADDLSHRVGGATETTPNFDALQKDGSVDVGFSAPLKRQRSRVIQA
jgi:hypothetical protein